jgi:hypothetical protein
MCKNMVGPDRPQMTVENGEDEKAIFTPGV